MVLDKFLCPFCGNRSTNLKMIGSDKPILNKLQVIGAGKRFLGCSKCNSTDRERLIYLFLKYNDSFFEEKGLKVLHIAPEKNLAKKIIQGKGIDYIAGDAFIQGYNFPSYVQEINILNIQYDNCSFDYVICNHVLQDVLNDTQGMSEINRVLKVGGKAIIQVPISKILKNTIENFGSMTEEERFEAYGFKYHFRIYEQMNYIKRLQSVGFKVLITTPKEDFQIHGINRNAKS